MLFVLQLLQIMEDCLKAFHGKPLEQLGQQQVNLTSPDWKQTNTAAEATIHYHTVNTFTIYLQTHTRHLVFRQLTSHKQYKLIINNNIHNLSLLQQSILHWQCIWLELHE